MQDHSAESLAEQKVRKLTQLKVVLEGCFDLLTESITPEAWLSSLGALAGCDNVTCMWWRPEQPALCLADSYGTLSYDSATWVALLEPAIKTLNPTPPMVLNSIVTEPDMLTKEYLVFCLATKPTRVIFILAGRHDQPHWTPQDHEHLQEVMEILQKPVAIKHKIAWLEDVVDLSNQCFDENPWGHIVADLDGNILIANRAANKITAMESDLRQSDKRLQLSDASLNEEFRAELAAVARLPKEQIRDYVWHRNLGHNGDPDGCKVAMLAFPLNYWNLLNGSYDRVVLLVLQVAAALALPGTAQISEFYDLTPAQARVAVSLLDNNSLEETAKLLNISINTVRTHLRAIYSKLHVENKTQLVNLLSNTLTGLNDD